MRGERAGHPLTVWHGWLSPWTWIVSPNLNADGGRSTSSLLVHLLLNLTFSHMLLVRCVVVVDWRGKWGKWRETFPLKLHKRITFIHSKKEANWINSSIGENIKNKRNDNEVDRCRKNRPFCVRFCFFFVFASAGVVSWHRKSYSRCRLDRRGSSSERLERKEKGEAAVSR